MKLDRMSILSGYFSDWGGVPTVLFWGNANGMSEFASLLRSSVTGGPPIALGSFVRSTDGRSILIRTVRKSEGMVPVGNDFEWRLDADTISDFVEKVDVLVDAKTPGHQYLETIEGRGLVVVASLDEYPLTLRPQ